MKLDIKRSERKAKERKETTSELIRNIIGLSNVVAALIELVKMFS